LPYFWQQRFLYEKIIFHPLSLLSLYSLKAQTAVKAEDNAIQVLDVVKVKETEHDFGQIPQGKPVFYFFEITNTGLIPLKLDNVQASCGCTTPEWNKDPIAAGATDKIKVGFNAANEGYFENLLPSHTTEIRQNNQNKRNCMEGPCRICTCECLSTIFKTTNSISNMKKLFFLAAAFVTGFTAMAQQKADEVIKIDMDKYDFGKIKQGVPVTTYFTVTNISDKPVVIENAWAGCGCTTPEWSKEPVAPKGTTKIKVGYNAAAMLHILTKDVNIKVAGVQETKVIKITGEVMDAKAFEAYTKTDEFKKAEKLKADQMAKEAKDAKKASKKTKKTSANATK
jgi:hypothetical protein